MVRAHTVELIEPEGATLRLEVSGDQTIWDAAAEAGTTLPHTCPQGWCLSCAGKVLAGEWDQSEAPRYFPADRAAGFILLCTARPRSPLRILVHQKAAMRDHRLAQGLRAPRG